MQSAVPALYGFFTPVSILRYKMPEFLFSNGETDFYMGVLCDILFYSFCIASILKINLIWRMKQFVSKSVLKPNIMKFAVDLEVQIIFFSKDYSFISHVLLIYLNFRSKSQILQFHLYFVKVHSRNIDCLQLEICQFDHNVLVHTSIFWLMLTLLICYKYRE